MSFKLVDKERDVYLKEDIFDLLSMTKIPEIAYNKILHRGESKLKNII